jgi:hypothetical protein
MKPLVYCVTVRDGLVTRERDGYERTAAAKCFQVQVLIGNRLCPANCRLMSCGS